MVPFKMSPGPVRKEVIEKFTKEVHLVEKEKVIQKDVGVNTDAWTPTFEVAPKAKKVDEYHLSNKKACSLLRQLKFKTIRPMMFSSTCLLLRT